MTDDWTEQEIENDFADLHGSVPYNEIIDDRREAFRRWLAEDRRRNRAEGWSEGYLQGSNDHCDNGGYILAEPCDVRSTNPYWRFA